VSTTVGGGGEIWFLGYQQSANAFSNQPLSTPNTNKPNNSYWRLCMACAQGDVGLVREWVRGVIGGDNGVGGVRGGWVWG